MTIEELTQETWRAWVKDKPFQSEDFAKGFQEGFKCCLQGKLEVEGGDKGKLISDNLKLSAWFTKARHILKSLEVIDGKQKEAEQFLKEVEDAVL